MDTTTSHGALLFAMFDTLAQYERVLTRERVIAGLAAAKLRGRRVGRPPTINVKKIKAITAALDQSGVNVGDQATAPRPPR